jgi:hypothetical protein
MMNEEKQFNKNLVCEILSKTILELGTGGWHLYS